MLIDDARAEELNGAEVLLYLRREADRLETLAAIFVGDQGSVRLRDRTEEARRGVADGVPFLRGDVEAVNVRNAGVVGRAVERLAVGSEDESFRRRRRQLERRDVRRLAVGIEV